MMKILKLTLVALLMLVAVDNATAQDNEKVWTIGLGINNIDFKTGGSTISDYLGLTDSNLSQFISRLTVERALNNGFSVEAAVSLNKIEHIYEDGDASLQYYAFDLNAKYDLNELFGDTSWFDPYLTAGVGYAHLDGIEDVGEGVFNVGYGFNFWFNEKIAVNVQGLMKTSFGDKIEDHFQQSVGVIFRFGGGSN